MSDRTDLPDDAAASSPADETALGRFMREADEAERRRAVLRESSLRAITDAQSQRHMLLAEADREADAIKEAASRQARSTRADARLDATQILQMAEETGSRMIEAADRYAVARRADADRHLTEVRALAEVELAEAGRRAQLLFVDLLSRADAGASDGITDGSTDRAPDIVRSLDAARALARDQLEQLQLHIARLNAELDAEAEDDDVLDELSAPDEPSPHELRREQDIDADSDQVIDLRDPVGSDEPVDATQATESTESTDPGEAADAAGPAPPGDVNDAVRHAVVGAMREVFDQN